MNKVRGSEISQLTAELRHGQGKGAGALSSDSGSWGHWLHIQVRITR